MTRARKVVINIISCFSILLQAGFASAAETPADEIAAYFRVMWGLLVVLALILALYAIFRKRFSIIAPRSGKAIRVVEIQPLMPRKSICLVEVKGKEYLLGIGQDNITLLAALDGSPPASFQEALDNSRAKL
jgi:flagellar protein FliO/FliZ